MESLKTGLKTGVFTGKNTEVIKAEYRRTQWRRRFIPWTGKNGLGPGRGLK